MDKLKCEDLSYYEKLLGAKSVFKKILSDIVENNMSQTSNSWILAARHKSLIAMLEKIRYKIMGRDIAMRQFPETWISDISYMARLVLEDNKDLARFCEFRINGYIGYEI